MSHLKQNQQDIVSRDKDRIFMVTIALPEIAEFSTRKTFSLQVLLTWDISTVKIKSMCVERNFRCLKRCVIECLLQRRLKGDFV